MTILAACAGAALYAAFLYGLHLMFTRQSRRDMAAGALFRNRVRKHVLKGAIWS